MDTVCFSCVVKWFRDGTEKAEAFRCLICRPDMDGNYNTDYSIVFTGNTERTKVKESREGNHRFKTFDLPDPW